MTPLPAGQVLDQYFLEARAKLLDLAAILDRFDRGAAADTPVDPRIERIKAAIMALSEKRTNRAEWVQELFSISYDPSWKLPEPQGQKVATRRQPAGESV